MLTFCNGRKHASAQNTRLVEFGSSGIKPLLQGDDSAALDLSPPYEMKVVVPSSGFTMHSVSAQTPTVDACVPVFRGVEPQQDVLDD